MFIGRTSKVEIKIMNSYHNIQPTDVCWRYYRSYLIQKTVSAMHLLILSSLPLNDDITALP